MTRRSNGQEWASPEFPLALLTYQTLSAADFTNYLDRYVQIKADWAPRDFGKPGIENFGAQSAEWHPTLRKAWKSAGRNDLRIVLHLQINDDNAQATGNVAWPADYYLELFLPESEPVVHLRLVTLGKIPNRMPEAMWLSFVPSGLDAKRCTLTKVDEHVAVSEVVQGGGRSMHAVNGPVTLRRLAEPSSLVLETLDAPVITLGVRSPLNYSPNLPDMDKGVHVNLFNNAWGTNYPQWNGGDWLYRFTLRTG